MKKVQEGNTKKRTNKKVLGIFLAGLSLVAISSLAGIFLAQNTIGVRKVKSLTKWDHVLWWKDGILGTVEDNIAMAATTPNAEPKYYQAIPQKYALGFIVNSKYIERAYRKIDIDSKTGKGKSSGAAVPYVDGKGGYLGGSYSPLRFADFYDGASYMGDLFDLRVYGWTAYSSSTGSASVRLYFKDVLVSHYHNNTCEGDNDQTGAISEWHFYPHGTLKALDELYYDPVSNDVECNEETQTCDSCKNVTTTQIDPVTGKKVKVTTKTCTYDENAYRNAEGKIVYTGVFREYKDGPIKYTAATMEKHLKDLESSIELLGVEEKGLFQGTVGFTDIDTRSMERYSPLQGVESIFTTHNSMEYAKKEGASSNKDWYKKFCPDATENDICYYSWGGEHESSTTDTESWIFFNFNSTVAKPFALLYAGCGHGSNIESSTYTIAHVINDDLSEIPEDVLNSAQEFRADYERIYGHSLEDDEFFEDHPDVDPDHVLRLFRIFKDSYYDPYTMNDLLEKLDNRKLNWYNCQETIDVCKIPQDPDHNLGKQVMGNGTVIMNGYDLVYGTTDTDGDRIYYANIDDTIGINFPNTCYSDTTSVKEVSEDE